MWKQSLGLWASQERKYLWQGVSERNKASACGRGGNINVPSAVLARGWSQPGAQGRGHPAQNLGSCSFKPQESGHRWKEFAAPSFNSQLPCLIKTSPPALNLPYSEDVSLPVSLMICEKFPFLEVGQSQVNAHGMESRLCFPEHGHKLDISNPGSLDSSRGLSMQWETKKLHATDT
jgi:hypothetical protein